MNALTDIQIFTGTDGAPAFVVIPYAEYLKHNVVEGGTIPNEVMEAIIKGDLSPIKAWREYLHLTQAEVASRLDVSQAAFAQMEAVDKPRKKSLKRVAAALGITLVQLDV